MSKHWISTDPARRWLDSIKTENKWGQSYQNIAYSFDAVGNVLGYENDCLDSVTGNYKTKQTYSYDNLYQLIKVEGETTYNPYQSAVPEFKSDYSQVFIFDPDGLGNMTSKVSTETVSPQKSIGDNLNYNFNYVYDENYAHRLVRAGDRYYKYDANGNITLEQDGTLDGSDETVTYHKVTKEAEDVYSTDYGWGLFKEEKSNGSATAASYKRTYSWNEKNQLISSVDANYSTSYVYGQDGQRSNKYTANSETLYFNKMWTVHTDSGNNVYGGQSAKNIYLGETRIVTKLNSGNAPTYQEEYYKQYYYHSDHLGSASLISDYKGDEYQRIEYTPYGETWVEKTQNTGSEFLPYKFTAKELDEETGLYYYGARYLDPKYSRWISTDPALGEYIPKAPIDEEAKKYNQNLPGMGGVFNHINGDLYAYAGNNPVTYVDPTGRELWGWIKFFQCGWNDNAPQTAAGYHNWMDAASIALFNIDHAEVDMGDYTIRFWKGDYGSTARFIARSDPRTFVFSLLIGMAGGETGIYNNDGKGLGSDGGSLMSSEGVADLGITNVQLDVKNKNGKTIATVSGLRAWPNVYNILNHSKKNNIYTETTYSFTDAKAASDFKTTFDSKIPKKHKKQFFTEANGNNVTITWGKNE